MKKTLTPRRLNGFNRVKAFIQFLLSSVLVSSLVACMSLPDNTQRTHSNALTINPQSPLVQRLLPEVNEHKGKTGVYMLYDGRDAFLARLALIEKATDSIDIQYYIWHDDLTGRLLLNRLYDAANRGVRIRLLLDDNVTKGTDDLLATFNNHPNIEVRLFNPFMQRNMRMLGYVTDFNRLNQRMHNKSLTADSIMSVVGGRNIGDEYFEVDDGLLFADLDVAVAGEVVPKIQQDFDDYWASQASYPLATIVDLPLLMQQQNKQPPHKTNPIEIIEEDKTKGYLISLFDTKFTRFLNKKSYDLVWADATFVSDDPDKVGGEPAYVETLTAKIEPVLANADKQVLIVSPYFVPTKAGTAFLTNLAKQGKEVIVVTNSLAATDVAIVHSGYAKYRQQLLNAGVQIYELKPNTNAIADNNMIPRRDASLHAKTFSVDGEYLFVGSFNFDPRSAFVNTELGIIFKSQHLASALNMAFNDHKDNYGYQVQLNNSQLEWHTVENGESVIYYHEPNSTQIERLSLQFLSLLPIERLL